MIKIKAADLKSKEVFELQLHSGKFVVMPVYGRACNPICLFVLEN